MSKTLIGFFRTREDGERAYHALLAENYSPDHVSLVMSDREAADTPALGPRFETGSQSGAETKAAIGGMAGLAIGMIAAALPGIGPLLAIGPLAGAIGGSAVGVAAGGLIGLLQDQGVGKEEAEFYAEGVKRGGAFITVQSGDRAGFARDIMERHGAIETDKIAEEWRGESSETPAGPAGTERE